MRIHPTIPGLSAALALSLAFVIPSVSALGTAADMASEMAFGTAARAEEAIEEEVLAGPLATEVPAPAAGADGTAQQPAASAQDSPAGMQTVPIPSSSAPGDETSPDATGESTTGEEGHIVGDGVTNSAYNTGVEGYQAVGSPDDGSATQGSPADAATPEKTDPAPSAQADSGAATQGSTDAEGSTTPSPEEGQAPGQPDSSGADGQSGSATSKQDPTATDDEGTTGAGVAPLPEDDGSASAPSDAAAAAESDAASHAEVDALAMGSTGPREGAYRLAIGDSQLVGVAGELVLRPVAEEPLAQGEAGQGEAGQVEAGQADVGEADARIEDANQGATWLITRVGSFYRICVAGSADIVLTAPATPGQPVTLSPQVAEGADDASRSQLWAFVQADDGTYVIVSAASVQATGLLVLCTGESGMPLLVTSGIAAADVLAQVADPGLALRLGWKAIEVTEGPSARADELALRNASGELIGDGSYYLIGTVDGHPQALRMTDSGIALSDLRSLDDATQVWDVKREDGGYVTLACSGVTLGTSGRDSLWAPVEGDDGLGFVSASLADESPDVETLDTSLLAVDGASQWTFVDASVAAGDPAVIDALAWAHRGEAPDGTFGLRSASSRQQAIGSSLDIRTSTGSARTGTATGLPRQQWVLATDAETGYVSLTNAESKKVLGTADAEAVSGTDVRQCDPDGSRAQLWVAESLEDGGVRLHSALDYELVLDVAGGSSLPGANVQVYKQNDTPAQAWLLTTPADDQSGYAAGNLGLSNGTYVLTAGVSSATVLDVNGGSTAAGANVQTWRSNLTGAQMWTVSHDESGYLVFTNILSGKVLEVTGAKGASGTNVQQGSASGSLGQRWVATPDGRGAYRLHSALDPSLTLDVAGSSTASGANVQVYYENGSKAQSWTFRPLTEVCDSLARANRGVVADGTYTLRLASSTATVLAPASSSATKGVNIQLATITATKDQTWVISHDAKGYLTIRSSATGMVLDVAGASTKSGANVQQYTSNGTAAQKWVALRNSDGSISLRPACAPHLTLDVNGGVSRDGRNVQVYRSNSTAAQRWVLMGESETMDAFADANRLVLFDGEYLVTTAKSKTAYLEVAGASKSGGANVRIWKRTATTAQTWTVTHDQAGYVILLNTNSGLALDVKGASKASGANVQQYRANGTMAQRWIAVRNADGTVTLRSAVAQGMALDLSGGNTANGTNVQNYASNGTVAQRWSFTNSPRSTFVTRNDGKTFYYDADGTLHKGELYLNGHWYYFDTKTGVMARHQFVTLKNPNKTCYYNDFGWMCFGGQFIDGNWYYLQTGSGDLLKNGTRRLVGYRGAVTVRTDAAGRVIDGIKLLGDPRNNIMHGVDLSVWDPGANLVDLGVDFAICKATEGNWYVDMSFAGFAKQAKDAGIRLGAYHFFSSKSSPKEQAAFFVRNLGEYASGTFLFLDFENAPYDTGVESQAGVARALEFLDEVYRLTGSRPGIYTSRSVTQTYDWSAVASKYVLWVAEYPDYNETGFQDTGMTFATGSTATNYGAWKFPTLFQYASTARLGTYEQGLDADIFFGSPATWDAMVRGK